MSIRWTNNATSVLASDITAGTLSITVTTGHGDRFPEIVAPHYCMVTLVDTSGNREIVKVTARASGSNTLTITRAQEGTSARSFAAGSLVELRITKNAMDEVSKAADINAQHYVCDASAADQGATTNSESLKSLVDALGATEEATIDLPHTGTGDTTTYTVGTDLTIPATVTLRVHKGARISPASGKTLTVDGIVQAGAYQIFAGDGTATVSTYPQDQAWWGNAQRFDATLDATLMALAALTITQGSLIIGTGTDAFSVLAKGTAGKILAMNSGATAPEWVASVIPSGTKMWFYQNTAPTGWTIDATPADALLAVKGGSQAYNANGGTQQGTWTQLDHTHNYGTLGASTHTHKVGLGRRADGAAAFYIDANYFPASTYSTNVADGSAHVSGTVINSGNYYEQGSTAAASITLDTGATANGASAATYRPLAQVGIICTKD